MQQPQLNVADLTRLDVGKVALMSGPDFLVEIDGASFVCRRAAGCVVEPAPGDTVLAAVHGSGAWIVMLLDKAKPGPMVIRSSAGLTLDADGETLRLSGDAVDIAARDRIASTSARWTLDAGHGEVRMGVFSLVAARASAVTERMRLLARTVDTVAVSLLTRAQRAFRRIEGLDRQSAGQSRLDVAEAWTVHSGRTEMRAKDKVRIDAEKIDLG